MRKLASIKRIKSIEPIKDKDLICLVSFYDAGWRVIARKNEVEQDGLVVYIECDAVLPVKPEFEFLRKNCYKSSVDGFKISVMKMCGIFSEGIVFPLSILPQDRTYKEGDDVSTILEIKEYEDLLETSPETINELKNKGSWYKRLLFTIFPKLARKLWYDSGLKAFPSKYTYKTDETRIQMFPQILNDYKNLDVYITEKMDGSSATYIYDGESFYICSRNYTVSKLPIDKAIRKYNSKKEIPCGRYFERIACKHNIPEKMKKYYDEHKFIIVIKGEICGPCCSFKRNMYKLKDNMFYLFDAYNTDTSSYFDLELLKDLAKEFDIPTVPIIEERTKLNYISIDEIMNAAKGKSVLYPFVDREGLVIRSCNPREKGVQFMANNRFSFKVLNDDFLLKIEK